MPPVPARVRRRSRFPSVVKGEILVRHFKNTAFPRGLILGASSLVLAACGGGGGDGGGIPGGPVQADHIELHISASRDSLPQNVSLVPSSIGGPYTSDVTVEAIARNGSRYVPVNNIEDFFTCNMIQGLDSASLYYHDGDDQHYTERDVLNPDGTPVLDANGDPVKNKVENAYRTVSGTSGAGAFTFHVGALNRAGTVVVRCSATDPQSGKAVAVEKVITVGSNSQLPTSIRVRGSNSVDYNSSPRQPLYTSPLNAMNQLQVQASVVDETGNPVPDPVGGAANLIVEILPSSTAAGSTLRVGGQSGQRVVVRTINGIAQVTALAGDTPGVLNVLFTGDALDNNVSNGVSLPIVQSIGIPVMDHAVTDLKVLGVKPTEACVGKAYAGTVELQGGYTGYPVGCALAGGALPTGVTLATACSLSGTPTAAGDFNFTVAAAQAVDPAIAGVSVEGKGDATIKVHDAVAINAAVALNTADVSKDMAAEVTAGKAPFTWAVSGAACTSGGWGTGPAIDANGLLTGTVTGSPAECSVTVTVTDDCGNSADSVVTVTLP